MKVLVACEESQAVTKEFRKLSHEAYSCDVESCSGGHPEWHIKKDVLRILNGCCVFHTEDGKGHHIVGNWDMIIAFPPCTHLAVSGARHFKKKREDGRQLEAILFFYNLINAQTKKLAIENPVNIIAGNYIKKHFNEFKDIFPLKPSQYIQPFEFGDNARKKTALWLKGLPKLNPTNIVGMGEIDKHGHSVGASSTFARDENGKILSWNDPRTAKIRSKTFTGIAKAMAEQWGKL